MKRVDLSVPFDHSVEAGSHAEQCPPPRSGSDSGCLPVIAENVTATLTAASASTSSTVIAGSGTGFGTTPPALAESGVVPLPSPHTVTESPVDTPAGPGCMNTAEAPSRGCPPPPPTVTANDRPSSSSTAEAPPTAGFAVPAYRHAPLLAELYHPFVPPGARNGDVPAHLQRVPAQQRVVQNLPLDRMTAKDVGEPIAVDRLLRWFPDLRPVLLLITCLTHFLALFKGPPPTHGGAPRRVGEGVTKDLPMLEGVGLVRRVPRRFASFFCDLFKVEKDPGETSRLITNATAINAEHRDPPHLELPTPKDLVFSGAKYKYHVVFDFRHYFHCFPLSEEIQRYFCFRSFVGDILAYCRLPMGWTWSMHIAQRVALRVATAVVNAVNKSFGEKLCACDVYVDGVRIMSDHPNVLRLACLTLVVLCLRLKIPINWKEGKSQPYPARGSEFVGVQHCTEQRAFRLIPKWCSDFGLWFSHKRSHGGWTFRDLLNLSGTIGWAIYALDWPAASYRFLFDFTSRVILFPKSSWDHHAPLSLADLSAPMIAAALRVIANDWQPFTGAGTKRIWAETDSTRKQWGHVLTDVHRNVYSRCAGLFPAEIVIHIAELLGALYTIAHVAVNPDNEGCTLYLFHDNEIAKSVLRKGHSGTAEINDVLVDHPALVLARRCRIRIVHLRINTTRNCYADYESRRLLPPDHKITCPGHSACCQ